MTTITPPGADTSAGTGSKAAPTGFSADFNLFLKMLTTQMQNQDPLNPMDSTQYTQQLAQYSQVEQTVQQTGTLKDILSHLTGQDMAQAATFIGREATFDSSVAGLTADKPARWGYRADAPITGLTATISDASGKVIETHTIAPSSASGKFDWDGTLSTGGKAKAGSYSVSFTGTNASGANVPVTASSIGMVQEVVNAAGTVSVGVNGLSLPLGKLISLTATNAG